MDKQNALIGWFEKHKKGYILFSGGFDSCAVLGAAIKAKSEVTPVWIDNGFNRADADDIIIQARNLGTNNLEIINAEPGENVKANPQKRCYHCKAHLLSLVPNNGLPIFDGTTASDLNNYRPGQQALKENNVLSPLAELGITSQQTKEIAIAFGADPLLAELESCLATRINYNNEITPQRLKTIYEVENYIINRTSDFNVRCRIDDDEHMRIELSKPESYQVITNPQVRNEIYELGNKACLFVTIDIRNSRPNEYDKKIKQ